MSFNSLIGSIELKCMAENLHVAFVLHPDCYCDKLGAQSFGCRPFESKDLQSQAVWLWSSGCDLFGRAI